MTAITFEIISISLSQTEDKIRNSLEFDKSFCIKTIDPRNIRSRKFLSALDVDGLWFLSSLTFAWSLLRILI